jgi:hypothetical protein
MATPTTAFKALTPFEQQTLFNGYMEQVKDLIDDAIGSADVESYDEALACLEDLDVCYAQATSLKDLIVNAIKAKK